MVSKMNIIEFLDWVKYVMAYYLNGGASAWWDKTQEGMRSYLSTHENG